MIAPRGIIIILAGAVILMMCRGKRKREHHHTAYNAAMVLLQCFCGRVLWGPTRNKRASTLAHKNRTHRNTNTQTHTRIKCIRTTVLHSSEYPTTHFGFLLVSTRHMPHSLLKILSREILYKHACNYYYNSSDLTQHASRTVDYNAHTDYHKNTYYTIF